MCGRYVCEEDQSIDLAALYRAVRVGYPDVALKSGEIFPTETVPLLTGTELTPVPAVWGFRGYGGKGVIINARAETAKEKVTFADAVTRGRCLVPATGYFEWDSAKAKYRFTPADRGLLYMAGLCRKTPDGLRFVIITTSSAPVGAAAAVHPRMPLLIPALSADDWMRDTAFALRYLQSPAVGAVPLTAARVV
jgi:putative SOS response-associated peptidase YedK